MVRLSLEEAFGDPAIIQKFSNIVKSANKELVENVSSLRTEVTSLRAALANRNAQIAALQSDVQHLKDANDALEQHGRRHSLRINGVSNAREDTTQAVVEIANSILEVDPPLDTRDISVSHRLPTRRNARAYEPNPIIVRFVSRADRDRVLKVRKNLKTYNANKDIKLYINEDLTAIRAWLFSSARSLQKQWLLAQSWTYNGAIKVKTPAGVLHTITTSSQLRQLVSSTWYCPHCIQTILPFNHFDEDEDFFGAVMEQRLNCSYRFHEMNSRVFVPFEINQDSNTPFTKIDQDLQFYTESNYIYNMKCDYYLENTFNDFSESKTEDISASFFI